jgi:phospholipase C
MVGDPFPGPNDPRPPNGTIFDRLSAHGISWKDYFVDAPSAGLFPYVLETHPQNMAPVAEFFVDCAAGTLPSYSIIDPEILSLVSDESPDDISAGQFYVEQVVNAVMSSPAWRETMLVVTYDEGGGYYDHIPPAPVPAPDSIAPQVTDTYGDDYTFTGFRVPTVVVAAWARPRFVSHVVCDHTSILATVEAKWNLPALTWRDANAHTLRHCLALDAPAPPFLDPPSLAPAQLPTSAVTCAAEDPTAYVP